MRRLRSVLLAENWDWVATVLADARHEKRVFPVESLQELQLVQDELDNRTILAQLTGALSSGAARGAIGDLDVDGIDTSGLDRAITFARSLGCKTIESSQMVATAQLVRRLRQALVAGDLDLAGELLDGVRGKVLAAAAAEEVRAIKYEVDNWRVIGALTSAVAAAAGDPEAGGSSSVREIGEGIPAKGSAAARAAAALAETDAGTDPSEEGAGSGLTALDAAIARTMEMGCRTAEARDALFSALTVRRLRFAVAEADWDFAEQVVREADKDSHRLIAGARPQVETVREELELRRVLKGLRAAVDDQDESDISAYLARGARLGLGAHSSTEVRAAMEQASLALSRLHRCKSALQAGLKAMDAPQLVDALTSATSIGFRGHLVDQARAALERIRVATTRATDALRRVDTEAMEASIQECEDVGLSLPLLRDMRALLALPRPALLQKQVRAAVAQGDADRVVGITMEIKSTFFEEGNRLDDPAFSLHNFEEVRPPQLVSSSYSLTDTAEDMLRWSSHVVHSSFTRLGDDAELRRTAARCFRSVLAFMGDRGTASGSAGAGSSQRRSRCIEQAQESLQEAYREEGPLRDEVLLQICKQLAGNPSEDSRARGWVLLHAALCAFPPSTGFENHLECFLRRHGRQATIRAMHLSLFRGAAHAAPTAGDLRAALREAGLPELGAGASSVSAGSSAAPQGAFAPAPESRSETSTAGNGTANPFLTHLASPMQAGASAARGASLSSARSGGQDAQAKGRERASLPSGMIEGKQAESSDGGGAGSAES